jgi:hypothetical protein
MFIGGNGIPERMSKQERESYLEDVKTMIEYKKYFRDTKESFYSGCYCALRGSLVDRVKRAFLNHPRPIKCTCGRVVLIRHVSSTCGGLSFMRIIIGCEKCEKYLKNEPNETVNELILRWNSMIEKERNNG